MVFPLHAATPTAPAAAVGLEVALAAVTVLAAIVYGRGLARVRHHPQGRRHQRLRPWALVAGVVSVAVIAGGPLGELLEHRMWTHMLQHVVLIMVCAPLLAWSAPGPVVLAGLPRGARRPLVRLTHRLPLAALLSAPVAWTLQVAAMWLWHLPAAYDLAVGNELAHLAEHASFLLTAWLFWWYLLSPSRHRLRGLPAVFYLAASVPPGAALGAVLTFPQHLLYPAQAHLAVAAGIDPLLDQRIAGLVMWVPLDFAYLVLAVLLFGRWLRSLEDREALQAVPAVVELRQAGRQGAEMRPDLREVRAR
ncbi:MAG TPA: cytochrome c oxidase assembly protein [Marmoricola sp.]|nr:cytochrome c oxidase assembly protein [Marmoricola sp.]